MILLITLAGPLAVTPASASIPAQFATCYDAAGVDAGDASPEAIATRLEIHGLLDNDEQALRRSLSIYEHMVVVADDEVDAQSARFSADNLRRRLVGR